MSVITDEMIQAARLAYGKETIGMLERWPKERALLAALTAVTPMIRAAALEEAAKVAERRHAVWNAGDGYFDGEGLAAVNCDVTACENIAAAIRALIAKEG